MLEIDVKLITEEEFCSIYNKNRLNPLLGDYIMEECYGEDLNKGVKINIYVSFKVSKDQEVLMKNMFKNNYEAQINDESFYWNKEKALGLMLFSLGIIFLFIYYLGVKNIEVFSELTLILGWLAIWESIYSILFNGMQRKMKIKKLRVLQNADINFITK